MADMKDSLQLADEHIDDVQAKIHQNPQVSQEEIWNRVNGIPSPVHAPTETPIPETSSAKTSVPTPNTVSHSGTTIKNLRTFQGDVAEAMKKQGTSVVSIALAEKKRQEESERRIKEAGLVGGVIPATIPQKESTSLKQTLEPGQSIDRIIAEPTVVENHETRNRIILITCSIIFLILGIGAIGTFYVFQKQTLPQVTEPAENKTIIAYNRASAIAVDNATEKELFETLARERREKILSNNETYYISLVKTTTDGIVTPITPAVFFGLFEQNAPASLIRAFGNKMMYGLYKTETNEPFLLIRVDSFDNAFTGMLEWEENLYSDVGVLFSPFVLPISEVVPQEGSTATTTVSKTLTAIDLRGIPFEDETIKNKDIRILRTKQGNTALLYSFIDKNILLITASEAVLQVMVNKVADQKLVR